MWFIWGLICWDIQISHEQSQPDQVSLSLIELCATDIIAVWIACDARDAANKSGLSNEDKKRLRTWNAWGFNGSRNHKLGLSETNSWHMYIHIILCDIIYSDGQCIYIYIYSHMLRNIGYLFQWSFRCPKPIQIIKYLYYIYNILYR